ncbi:hypothetical protein DZB83_25365 [Bacillus sp. dmp10]|nr:hypothetical protein DZB83_25365 [Bacillus sp. dmp10]
MITLLSLLGVPPHTHQAKILKYPQNENFIILHLFMRIQHIFFTLGSNQLLDLIAMGYRHIAIKLKIQNYPKTKK